MGGDGVYIFYTQKAYQEHIKIKNEPVCFHQILSDFYKPVHSIHPILIEINHIHFECIIHFRMTSSLFRMITQKICCRIEQIFIIITCSEHIIIIIFRILTFKVVKRFFIQRCKCFKIIGILQIDLLNRFTDCRTCLI